MSNAGGKRTTPLSELPIGSSVFFMVNNTTLEFFVAHHGKPSSIYDDSCDGAWLMLKDLSNVEMGWHTSNVNEYANAQISTYLNTLFYNGIDSSVRGLVKSVKVPYTSNGSLISGASGLPVHVFLPSAVELNVLRRTGLPTGEGGTLDYFTSNSRVAHKTGTTQAVAYWTRTPNVTDTAYAFMIDESGSAVASTCSFRRSVRPVLILPEDARVDSSGSLIGNATPSVPSSISYPTEIMAGSRINISWGASTDADNNLAGYKLEVSYNGGTSWSLVYQGAALTTSWTAPSISVSPAFRVNAYDTVGAESEYRIGPQATVINNTAPTAPSSISVPLTIRAGSSVTVAWGASSDTDGNLSGYVLERSTGSRYVEVYRGAQRSFTETVDNSWNTLRYRVKAFDPYAESDYTTSPERTVTHSNPPIINCSYADGADLGTKTSGFSISYSVSSPVSGDTLTVTEKMDGVVKRTFVATAGATNSFAVTGEYFMKLLNGSHVMTIAVSNGSEEASHRLNFSKLVTKAAVQLSEAISASSMIKSCRIVLVGNVPSDATLVVEVSNNASDTTPVWEDCTANVKAGTTYTFFNSVARANAFNFRAVVQRGETAGYISSIQGVFTCE